MENPVTKFIDAFDGKVTKAAAAIGVSYQALRKWERRGYPPAERALPMQRVSGGRVTARDLRPDLYPKDADVAA